MFKLDKKIKFRLLPPTLIPHSFVSLLLLGVMTPNYDPDGRSPSMSEILKKVWSGNSGYSYWSGSPENVFGGRSQTPISPHRLGVGHPFFEGRLGSFSSAVRPSFDLSSQPVT